MYQKIMVPLDGSKLAECVLPHVESLAKGCQIKSIQLVQVIDPLKPSGGGDYVISPDLAGKINGERKVEAETYLKKLASGMKWEGIKVSWEVLTGLAAETLAEYGTKSGADLIVIATHGRSGVSRWVFGSVAERILRSACIPVLMVRAPGCVPGL
jgi:nucleotide-binding universal stress UspA family protein